MTRIKKKVQMEAKNKKKKKSVHRIATLSTCFADGEQISSFKPYASRPQTSGLIKTNNSKIIIDERPNTYVSVLYLLAPPVVLFFVLFSAMKAEMKVLSPQNDELNAKVNFFKVMHNVTKFRSNLKNKMSDSEHAQLLSKLPIQKRLFLQRSRRNKAWTMQKIKKKLVAIKGRLPYLQKYKMRQLVNYSSSRLKYGKLESVRQSLLNKHTDSDLNVLRENECMQSIIANIFQNGCKQQSVDIFERIERVLSTLNRFKRTQCGQCYE